MSGAYIAEPYDQSDPVVRESAMQAAVEAISFDTLTFYDPNNTENVHIYAESGRINVSSTTIGEKSLAYLSDLTNLNGYIVNLVSANTGRSPINGEAITYEAATGNLIWGAPVYDASLDFQTTFNSMYLGSLN